MMPPCILLGSQNELIIPTVREVADEMAIIVQAEQKIEDFLLNVQENDYKAIIFDLNMSNYEGVKTVRLIRRMRPKIPLITLIDKIDKKIGGQILSEGVFQLVMSPPSKENLRAILMTALKKVRGSVLES
jgi:DNA-binding NarL/FixJ family response regulator